MPEVGRFKLDDYVTVNERLLLFRQDHPNWGLVCNLRLSGDAILARAEVTDETGRVIAVGHAEEIRGDGMVNKTSPIENAETSAWGRALANLGYEVKRGVASREEMEKVARKGVSASTGGSRAGAGPSQDQRTGEENGPGHGNVTPLPKPSKEDIARHPANGPALPQDQAIAAKAQSLGLSDDERIEVLERVVGVRSGKDVRPSQVALVFEALEATAKAKTRG